MVFAHALLPPLPQEPEERLKNLIGDWFLQKEENVLMGVPPVLISVGGFRSADGSDVPDPLLPAHPPGAVPTPLPSLSG
ncbi:MAG: hypothetical protein ABIF09_05815, partial [Gemmatimonadota bacterium]